MERAIVLARRGAGLAHPNPMVGAVVVKGGRAIGEGFHIYDRRDHAEIVALKRAGAKARGAALYVSLEPCCTTGRTGPCTDAIIAAGVKRVYVAMTDPNPRVAGRGVARLRRAGIAVHLCENLRGAAEETNEGFAKWIRTGRPFVTLKAALTLDGKIAERAGKATVITERASLEAVQRLRHESDALLTGIGTVLVDDPRLTDRSGEPRRRPLLRAVVDSRLRLPLKSRLVRSAKNDLIVFTLARVDSPKARALGRAGVEIVRARDCRGRVCLESVLEELGRREMLNVLLEAGAELNGAALEAGIVDKMVLFYAPKIIGPSGVPMARLSSRALARLPTLTNVTVNRYAPDFAVQGYFHDVYGNHRTRRED
jgi:diaminohydroxyphosphoribosylaminopyrimidine deaminase / 5-amino-6-(5-phosphoribosylamino)uracil reductase